MLLLCDATNAPVLTKSALFFRQKTLMKAAGWLCKGTGDGLSLFSSTADIITVSGTGAGGFNANAWMRMQSPDGQREVCFQYSDKIKYSWSSKFTGGSPSATVMPTATDEQYVLGTAGAGGSWVGSPDNTYRWIGACDTQAPYGMYGIGWVFGSATVPSYNGVFIYDPLMTSTYHASDVDPYVIVAPTSGTTALSYTNLTGNCWYGAGLTGAGFTQVVQNTKAFIAGAPRDLNPGLSQTDAYLIKRYGLPVHWTRGLSKTLPIGDKGWSSFLRTMSIRSGAGITMGIFSARDRVCFDDFSLPWGGARVAL